MFALVHVAVKLAPVIHGQAPRPKLAALFLECRSCKPLAKPASQTPTEGTIVNLLVADLGVEPSISEVMSLEWFSVPLTRVESNLSVLSRTTVKRLAQNLTRRSVLVGVR